MADHRDSDSDTSPLLAHSKQDIKKLESNIRFPSCRFVFAVMGFLGFMNVYALRVNLSVAMVAMVNSSYQSNEGNMSADATCPNDNNGTNTTSPYTGEFNWDGNLQGLVLGSFFYGYIVTQIPGGFLAERIGGKWLYGLGVLCTAVFTLLTPVAARISVYLFIVVRVIEGIGEGVTFPAMCAMLAKWAPPLERSKLGTFVYSGAQFGTVLSMPISGLLCQYGPFGGWPSVFYIFGALGCLWFVFWCFLVYNNPNDHPRISEDERAYIVESIGEEKEKLPVPWLAIFSSVRFWAILIGHVTFNWGFYTMLTCLPTFMKEILHFNMSQNGFISALPYLVMGIMMAGGGSVADMLRRREILHTTSVRKLASFIGLGTPAAMLAFIGYAGCDKVLVVAFLTIAVGVSGVAQSGYGVNHLDLAPPFAGTLFGLTNAAATIPGFLGPQVVGALTGGHVSRLRWQIVFWISSGVYIIGLVFYLIFGVGVEQPWAKPEYAELQRLKKQSKQTYVQSEVPDGLLQLARPESTVYEGY